ERFAAARRDVLRNGGIVDFAAQRAGEVGHVHRRKIRMKRDKRRAQRSKSRARLDALTQRTLPASRSTVPLVRPGAVAVIVIAPDDAVAFTKATHRPRNAWRSAF